METKFSKNNEYLVIDTLLQRAFVTLLVLDFYKDMNFERLERFGRYYIASDFIPLIVHPPQIMKANLASHCYGKLKLSEEMVLHVLSFFGDRDEVIYA